MKLLTNMKVSNRILVVFGVIITLYIGNIAYNILSLEVIKDRVDSIYNNRLMSINYLLQADRDGYQARLAFSEALTNISRGKRDEQEVQEKFAAVQENMQQLNERFNKFKDIYLSAGGKQNAHFDKFHSNYEANLQLINKLQILLKEQQHSKAVAVYFEEFNPAFESLREAIDKLTEISETEAEQEYSESLAKAEEIKTLAFIFFGSMIMILVLAGIALTRSIVGQLGCEPAEAARIANSLANGNLQIEFRDSNQGLYKDLRNMVEKLRMIIMDVSTGAENIASASGQMSAVSQQLSQGANEQAASAEEVTSSMEEMTTNIEQNSQNARQTEQIALDASKEIKRSSEAVDNTVESMKTIASKITIIGEIARQTNILALNAAVEAARAGEHGKGFAVVAAEVRKLAERSQIAAAEIDELSKSSVAVAEKSGKLLADIVPNIEKTATLVQEINIGSEEQSSSAKQISSAIQQLNQIVQQNAASAEEMASGSEELAAQADTLKDLISFFTLDEEQHTSFAVKQSAKKAGAYQGKSAKSENREFKQTVLKERIHPVITEHHEKDEFEEF